MMLYDSCIVFPLCGVCLAWHETGGAYFAAVLPQGALLGEPAERRGGAALRKAHASAAEFLPPMQEDPDLIDFCLYSPELSRDFRGLRVWLPLKMHGMGTFRKYLDEKLDLARWAADELARIGPLEIVAQPQLSLLAFRLNRPGLSDEELNGLNRKLLDRINAKKRVFLTATTLRGRFVLRICVLSFRTHMERMEAALEDIHHSLREV